MLASSTYGVGLEHTQLSPEEGNGIILATSFVDDLDTAEARDFVSRFHAYTGDTGYVGEYGEYGERGVTVWAEAVRQAGDASPDAVIEALASGQVSVAGAGGQYTVGRSDQPHHDGHPHRARQHDPDLRRDQLVLAAPAAGYAAGLQPAREPRRQDPSNEVEVE